MTLIICVCDYWQRRHYYNRNPFQPSVGDTGADIRLNGKPVRRLALQLDAISGNYWLRELLEQHELRRRLQHEHGIQLVWLTLRPPERDTIDYKHADMLAHTIWEHIELEHLMSWLSTLGGGFSALGEQFERCVSRTQYRIVFLIAKTIYQFYSVFNTGHNSGKNLAATAYDWHATGRSVSAGTLQALLQYLADTARPAAPGQAPDTHPVSVCHQAQGARSAAAAHVPGHLAATELRVR